MVPVDRDSRYSDHHDHELRMVVAHSARRIETERTERNLRIEVGDRVVDLMWTRRGIK